METSDLSYSDAIEQVMLHNGYFAPLKFIYKEIWKYKDKSKIIGKTPENSIQERVQRDSRFTRIASGVYALTAYLDKLPGNETTSNETTDSKHKTKDCNNVESESDFYRFLTINGNVNRHSRRNYLSWLKFLSQKHSIDSTLTTESIEIIIAEERIEQKKRSIYNTERDLGNFKSALRKYLNFINSDYYKQQEQTVLSEINKIESDINLQKTERISIQKSRIGQGIFRHNLIQYWNGCSISNCRLSDLLIASHIKPWTVSDNRERLDTFNGLLLLPNYDKLFDKGYISFDKRGKIIFSHFLPESDRQILNLNSNISLIRIDNRHGAYLKYHNENCLIQ